MIEGDTDRINAWLDEHANELVSDLQELLRIPSLQGEAAPNAPFGPENRRALDWALEKSREAGMTTRDIEGYCGWAEFGQGERLIMSLGHLDVVPVGPGWKHEPFGAEIDGEYLYSRGATDDKGPTVASFYAMRAIQACCPDLNARYRSVFGCNEESGFKCVERYNETEEPPAYGIAPDSDWPCIHGEKNICNIVIERDLPTGPLEILEISGGSRPNIVIDECRVHTRLTGNAEHSYKEHDPWDRNLTTTFGNGELNLTAVGKAAHGSTPFRGDSAAVRALRYLKEIAPVAQQEEFGQIHMLCHPGGNGLGIAGADDETGPLTCNLGIVETDGKTLRLTFNIRYPVTWSGDSLRQRCEKALSEKIGSYTIVEMEDSQGLYFPIDHPLVRTIVDVYAEQTGERLEPGTMGGGTYARAMANTVSVGAGWPGDGPAHETDERVKVEHLHKMARIYAGILYRLGTLQERPS